MRIAPPICGAVLAIVSAFACEETSKRGAQRDASCDAGTCAQPDAGISSKRDANPMPDVNPMLTCDDLSSRGNMALVSLMGSLDTSCQNDADCIDAPLLSCSNQCSRTVVAKAALSAIQGQLDALEQGVCASFAKQGCELPPSRCAFGGIPSCLLGKCFFREPSGEDAGSSGCDRRLAQIDYGLRHVAEGLDSSCKTNDDCTNFVVSDACWSGCVVTVSKSAAAAFDAARASVDQALCEPFLADGCRPEGPSFCGGFPSPECVDGRCTGARPPVPDAGESCTEQTDSIKNQLQLAGRIIDKKCSTDGDCKAVLLASKCYGSCTYAAASNEGASAFVKSLPMLESATCPGLMQAACTVQQVSCDTPPVPTCNAGTCSLPSM